MIALRLHRHACAVLLAWTQVQAAVCAAETADPLPGRLFHSPAERTALDHGTERLVRPVRGASTPPAVAPENSRTLTGFVLRSDGRNSYWLEAPPGAAAGPVNR